MFTKITQSIFLLTLIIFTSCGFQNNDSYISDIRSSIDSLKVIYAPDTRIVLWNITVENDNDSIKVIAEVDKPKAKIDLEKTLNKKYPNLHFDIILLPNKQTNSIALINNSVSCIRAKGSHRAELVNQALLGTPIKILKKEESWYLVQTPNMYLGWINSADIVKLDSTELKEYKNIKKIIYNKQTGSSYTQANINSQVVTDLVIGCILPVISTKKDFYEVKYDDEVIDMNVIFNKYPKENKLVETAKKYNGIPYLWGGASAKSIDCSGFTSNIYFLNGIILQRDASQQIKYGKEITNKYEYTSLLSGDLLFFGRRASDSLPEKVTHVAMYIGDSEFIHASGKVKINSMDSLRTNYITGYNSSYIKTVRIIGEENGSTIEKVINNKFYKTIISK